MQIHILSAPIQTGKTTSLQKFCAQQTNCAGILTPVLNGKRFFYSISSKESRAMEADENELNYLEVGKYKFSKSAFEWAIEQIKEAARRETDWLILDEIGPLELKGKGFAEVLNYLLRANLKVKNLLLVVRSSALAEVYSTFEIEEKSTLIWKGN